MSEPRRRKALAVLTAATAVTVLVLIYVYIERPVNSQTLSVNGHTYSLLIASTAASQEKGLGDRRSLPADEGMLFIFNAPAIQCFWMKDMYFPIDMVWVGAARQVLYIQSDVQPSSYPDSYCPNVQAKYVIELNAWQTKHDGMKIGQSLKF